MLYVRDRHAANIKNNGLGVIWPTPRRRQKHAVNPAGKQIQGGETEVLGLGSIGPLDKAICEHTHRFQELLHPTEAVSTCNSSSQRVCSRIAAAVSAQITEVVSPHLSQHLSVHR
jgi:hypothetical protein